MSPHDNGADVNQAQDALHDQIIRVLALATAHGEYDAADWISRAYFGENTTFDSRTLNAR